MKVMIVISKEGEIICIHYTFHVGVVDINARTSLKTVGKVMDEEREQERREGIPLRSPVVRVKRWRQTAIRADEEF